MVVTPEGVTSLAVIKKAKGVVKKNPELRSSTWAMEWRRLNCTSKMNALGGDIVSLITQIAEAFE